MSLDLAFDEGQQAIEHALRQFCADRCDADAVKEYSGAFPSELWRELAGLGMLAIGTPEGDGGALEVAAMMEALGASVFPGPLVGSLLATQVLPENDRNAIIDGSAIVSAGVPPLMPWAPCATVFLEIEGDRVFRARPVGGVTAVETLGGEPWGRVELERTEELDGGPRALVFAEIALSSYLASAATTLVEAASEHAATRTQFGRAIGEFQAVAHPLADCAMRLSASTALARKAAFEFDDGDAEGRAVAQARTVAGAARLSANAAALEAAYVCHQVFGANGITLEGPVFHYSRRIRQLASRPLGGAAHREQLLASFGMAAVD